MLFCPAALPLSRQTLTYTAEVIRRHRKQASSPWRKLNPGRQALLVLAYLRKGETFAELAAGFGVGTATAWRYVTETVALLAARSPSCGSPGPGPGGRTRLPSHRRHLNSHRPGRGRPAVLFRQAPQARYEPAGHSHSGRGHRVGVRAAARRRARSWRTRATPAPGSTSALRTGGGTSQPPRKTPTGLTPGSAAPANAPTAQLKTWRILRKLRCCRWKAGQLAKAIHVLQAREAGG
jgi:Helix-turn-helix of DDE superfamily endonuclease